MSFLYCSLVQWDLASIKVNWWHEQIICRSHNLYYELRHLYICIRKKIGPRIDPCRTPRLTLIEPETSFVYLVSLFIQHSYVRALFDCDFINMIQSNGSQPHLFPLFLVFLVESYELVHHFVIIGILHYEFFLSLWSFKFFIILDELEEDLVEHFMIQRTVLKNCVKVGGMV